MLPHDPDIATPHDERVRAAEERYARTGDYDYPVSDRRPVRAWLAALVVLIAAAAFAVWWFFLVDDEEGAAGDTTGLADPVVAIYRG